MVYHMLENVDISPNQTLFAHIFGFYVEYNSS